MQEIAIMQERDKLWDIKDVKIDRKQSVKDKMEGFGQQIEEALTHRNEEYTVRVHFGSGDYSATDAIKLYLKQIAQLKY